MQPIQQVRRFAGAMKRRPTWAEQRCAERLEAAGYELERQVILGFYIADVVIPRKLLIVELDGPGHDRQYDAQRDRIMRAWGLNVVRISNSSVETFDIDTLAKYPDSEPSAFRSVLGRAFAGRGKALWKQKEKEIEARNGVVIFTRKWKRLPKRPSAKAVPNG